MFPNRRFYIIAAMLVLLLAAGYGWHPLFVAGKWGLGLLLLSAGGEAVCLYARKRGIVAARHCPDRFSNGDENKVEIRLENRYAFPVKLSVVDEIPFVFQRRDVAFSLSLAGRSNGTLAYHLRPVERGVYGFGQIRVFASTRLGLLARRFTCGEKQEVKVYPSYVMLRKYELMAIHNNLTELGIKKVRRVGYQTEFEQIKDYVQGDDYRTINWKASARRHQLMVNVYQDERAQQVYSVIDKGRVMQQAFEGMTLFDYAVNAALVLSYVAIRKEDKAGLATFDNTFDTFIPASRQKGQMQTLMEGLYRQDTSFGETDFSALCVHFNKQVGKRSLVVLYTNFSSLVEMNRQLAYLEQLARKHCVLVVFFEDRELTDYVRKQPQNTEEYYRHVVAEKFVYEKRLIVSTLKRHGVYALLTTPESLSVDVVNRYIEMKSRRLL